MAMVRYRKCVVLAWSGAVTTVEKAENATVHVPVGHVV